MHKGNKMNAAKNGRCQKWRPPKMSAEMHKKNECFFTLKHGEEGGGKVAKVHG